MALLDICLKDSENQGIVFQARGNVGVIVDVNASVKTQVSEIIPPVTGGGPTYFVFGS